MAEAIVGDSAQSARAAVAQAAVAHAAVAQHRLSLKAGRFDLGIWLINRYITRVMAAATRLLLTWFALWVLTAHILITACVPAPLLLLSQHDHIVLGKVTAEQWAAHLQWHLHEIDHHYMPSQPDPAIPSNRTGIILSVEGCDMNALQSFYVTVRGTTPEPAALDNAIVSVHLPPLLEAEGRPALLRVPCPPPRIL